MFRQGDDEIVFKQEERTEMDIQITEASTLSGQNSPHGVKKILHIDSSVMGAGSASRQLTARILDRMREKYPQAHVLHRDLTAEPLPYMTFASLPGAHPLSAKYDLLSGQEQKIRHQSDAIVDEFIACDTLVLGAPMYNFGIAAQLKSWLDRIVIPNKTFRYGPDGQVGLAGSKRVIAVITRGSLYGPASSLWNMEHAETYLRAVLSFLGISNPEMIVAEGIALDRKSTLSAAMNAVEQLVC